MVVDVLSNSLRITFVQGQNKSLSYTNLLFQFNETKNYTSLYFKAGFNLINWTESMRNVVTKFSGCLNKINICV